MYTEYTPKIEEGFIEIDSVYSKSGDIVTAPVNIQENIGIADINFILDYDKSVLTPTVISSVGILRTGIFTSNLETGISANEQEQIVVYWGSNANVTENG